MKRVKGYISARPLGCYDFDFFVEDDVSDEEIKEMVDKRCQLSMHYDVESGYEAETEIVYRKKGDKYETYY